MKIADRYRYKKCIAAQTRVEQIENLLDEIKHIINSETVFDDEWVTYTLTAKKSMLTLAKIVDERAKSYIGSELF